jgi:hypothetical protein
MRTRCQNLARDAPTRQTGPVHSLAKEVPRGVAYWRHDSGDRNQPGERAGPERNTEKGITAGQRTPHILQSQTSQQQTQSHSNKFGIRL